MIPAPLGARRRPPLRCALAVLVALLLGGCGDGAAAVDRATPPPERRPAGQPCPAKVGAFVASLERLRRQLAVGLSYEQYAARMKGLETSYEAIPVGHLGIGCLTRTGAPAEQALNEYAGAANAWGECLADPACTTASIEPVLQRRWRRASGLLDEAL